MRILVLFSGGYDSTLSSIYLGREHEISLLYFDLLGLEPPLPWKISRKISGILGREIKIYLVPFSGAVKEISEKVERRYRQLVLKRIMFRIATWICEDMGLDGIGTGEVIGQVSTQTLRSLRAIEEVTHLPVLRPVAGMDKEEIIEEIRKYGLYDMCSKVKEYCNIAGRRVVVWPDLDKLREEEKKVMDVLERIRWKEYSATGEIEVEYLTKIPEGAILVDLRQDKKIPGAISIEELDLDKVKGKIVVLYCKSGGLSAEYARELRKMGINAFPLSPKAGRKLINDHK